MSGVQMLGAMVRQQQTAAVDEMFWLFGRSITEHEEEAELPDAAAKPRTNSYIAVFPPDVQQLLVSEEEAPPEQQDLSPSLDQEDPEPPHIKEEQEELWTSQEGKRLQGPEEADITEFPFTPVPVKSEDDEEKPQSSQLHQSQTEENREAEPLASSSTEQMKTEADGEDCGVSEPARNLDPASHLQPTSDGKTSDSSEPKTEDSDDEWKETREPQSGLDSLKNNEAPVSRLKSQTREKHFSCSVCGKMFLQEANLQTHKRVHTSNKPYGCRLCGRGFSLFSDVKSHKCVEKRESDGGNCDPARNLLSLQPTSDGKTSESSEPETEDSDDEWKETREPQSGLDSQKSNEVCVSDMKSPPGENNSSNSTCSKVFLRGGKKRRVNKPVSCTECGKILSDTTRLNRHMRIHTGEKPYECTVCGQRFRVKALLRHHMRLHTGSTICSCSVCGKTFNREEYLKHHMKIHTGEKCFKCSVCHKRFHHKHTLVTHIRVHTGEKPYRCSVCYTSFRTQAHASAHMRVHTGERPYSCRVCGRSFKQLTHVRQHRCSGGSSRRSCSAGTEQ